MGSEGRRRRVIVVGGVRGRVREWVSECPPWEATMIMVLVLAVSPVVLTLLP